MNFMGIGMALRWVWGILSMPLGGGAPKRNELLDEMRASREQFQGLVTTLLTNHLAHLDDRMQAQTVAMTEMTTTLKAVAESVGSLHGQIRGEHDDLSKKMDNIDRELARIEGKIL